ncbi:MAG: YitT family protein [Atopobiaceae bacterium]|nr:YitT family protein [Atopobiaceae bacterium]
MPYLDKRLQILVTLFCIIGGNVLLAFLVAAFIIPHGIIMGGTTGIGIVLGNMFPQLDVATVVLVLNVALLLFGRVVLGRKFFVTTAASSVLYPVALGLIQRIPGIDTLTNDSLLAALFAGSLMGLALGQVMRVGSSTGGMDVVSLVLHHWFHVPVSILVYVTDLIIMGGQALFSDPEKILLGLLVLVLEAVMLDKTMVLGKAQMQLLVISDHYEEIRQELLSKAQVGVTLLELETGLRREEQKGVLCVVPQRKLYETTELVRAMDQRAFITITQINEVRGQGFTQERVYLPLDGSK